MFSQLIQLQSPLQTGFSADLLVSGTPPLAFFAGSEHSELTAAVAKFIRNLPNDIGGTGGPQANVYTVFR